MATIRLLKGDCLQKLKELEDNSIDSVVTDPPYEIGFMGKGWDDSGIANNPELWKEVLRVLKPGGHLLSFSHSRTYHRQAVAVEDAGFEIRDQIMWIYGSGFPKSHNIGKAVDKIEGNEREVVGEEIGTYKLDNAIKNANTLGKMNQKLTDDGYEIKTITKGNSDWEGWGTALKPAHEPIVMARKPFKGTVADNVLEWGTGGINVDGCRIGYEDTPNPATNPKYRHEQNYKMPEKGQESKGAVSFSSSNNDVNTEGRFPANIIFDEEAGKILDKQSGKLNKQGKCKTDNKSGWQNEYVGGDKVNAVERKLYLDQGGASRFFYCPKASKKDRNEGMPEQVPQFTGRPRREDGSVIYKETHPEEWNDVMKDKPRREKTSLAAAEEILQEKKIKGRDAGQDSRNVPHKARPVGRQNIHPTVKPTDLMAYLIRLVTPKGGIVLDPFMGSGSTGKACVREGMNFIGIEREDEYMEIAKTRIEHEQKKNKHTLFFDI
jgi:site-specific DNA-methyltransferase (adenine-specific)